MQLRNRVIAGVPVWGWITIGCVVVLIAWLYVFKEYIAPTTPSPRGRDVSSDRAVASLGCKDWIGRNLKAPSQAEWGPSEILQLDTHKWSVVGTVDAPNAFGVMLRTEYVCEVTVDGNNWTGNYLTLDGVRVT